MPDESLWSGRRRRLGIRGVAEIGAASDSGGRWAGGLVPALGEAGARRGESVHECRLAPGLLQSEGYARALFESRISLLTDDQLEARVAARLE
ncbi:hypothetical protein GCM10023257_44890 [Streptomyces hyderabadensis]|uniref:DUF5753 domain-containing protein n=1 Tax=Streptomyces hyderabadensis TaxID=598549 RepID=A0ABP9IG96_9ACTN